jgi:hypothetical protein
MSRDRLNERTRLHAPRAHAADVDEDEYTEADRAAARRASNVQLRQYMDQIQRKESEAVSAPDQMHAAAAQGTATPAQALPHADRIQASFGPAHDVSSIRAHIDLSSARAMGADAYATGNDVVFAGAPDLHTAAHEAAHVVQQSQGVNLRGGIGEAGDEHERRADAVADRVVKGESAADLLGTRSAGTTPKAGGIQRKAVAPADPSVDTTWQDKGNLCERTPPSGSCFRDDKQRDRYTHDFKDLVTRALANYQNALTWAKVEQLVQKDDEVGFIGTMLVSLAGGYVLGHLVGALAAARNGALNHVVSNLSEQAIPGASTSERVFGSLNDQTLQAWTSAGFEATKGAVARQSGESANVDSASEKQQTLSYLDHLKERADSSFREFETETLANSDDAGLLVAWLAMQEKNHSEAKYRQIVKAKVDGFKKSGVMDIGHKNIPDRRHDGMLHVDTRVVWVKSPGGTRLHFQSQKSIDAGFSRTPTKFDEGFDREIGVRVPDDYVDVALARSEARWAPLQPS